jgi:predicted nucleic acid-binding protein
MDCNAAEALGDVYQTERVELASTIRLRHDPDDDVFLETAVDGRAALPVAGDKAGLGWEMCREFRLFSASEAVTRLRILNYRV